MKKYIVLGLVFAVLVSFGRVLEAKKKTYLVGMKLYKVTRVLEEEKKEKIIGGNVFDDELIQIKWTIKKNDLKFELRNKTGGTISIVWEQSVYLDRNNKKLRLTHKGVKKEKMLFMMQPGEIPPNKKIKERVYPCEYFHEVPKTEINKPLDGSIGDQIIRTTEWKKKPLYRKKVRIDKSADFDFAAFEEDLRKPVGVILLLQAGGYEYEYMFTFKPDVKEK